MLTMVTSIVSDGVPKSYSCLQTRIERKTSNWDICPTGDFPALWRDLPSLPVVSQGSEDKSFQWGHTQKKKLQGSLFYPKIDKTFHPRHTLAVDSNHKTTHI